MYLFSVANIYNYRYFLLCCKSIEKLFLQIFYANTQVTVGGGEGEQKKSLYIVGERENGGGEREGG